MYDVLVQFQAFAAKEKQEIYDIIEQHPILLAHILNGELPDELLNALCMVGTGVGIFYHNYCKFCAFICELCVLLLDNYNYMYSIYNMKDNLA